MKRDIQIGVDDPLVNLTEFEDTTLDEGYGSVAEKPMSNTGTVSQAMIKRFNQHSIMVLKASKNNSNDGTPQNGTNQITSSTNENTSNNTKNDRYGPATKKQRILEKITYDDLENVEQNTNIKGTQLNLSKVSINGV